jgi:hypothetical protein
VDSFGQALGQHLLRRRASDGNSDSARGDIQLGEDSVQPFEAGQVGHSGGDLECPPLNDSLRGQDNSLLTCPDCYLHTAPQEEAQIGTGKHRPLRAGWNPIKVEPTNAASYPGSELTGPGLIPEELAEWNVR